MRTEGGQELGLMLTMVHLNVVLRLTFCSLSALYARIGLELTV